MGIFSYTCTISNIFYSFVGGGVPKKLFSKVFFWWWGVPKVFFKVFFWGGVPKNIFQSFVFWGVFFQKIFFHFSRVQSQVESYQRLKKWYLMPPCLTLSTIKWGSRVKWNNPGNGVAPSPTSWCSSYCEGNLFGPYRLRLPTLLTIYEIKYYSKILWLWNFNILMKLYMFTNGLGDLGSIPDCVIPKTLKMVLDISLLNTQQHKIHIKSKVEQSRERNSVFPYTSV